MVLTSPTSLFSHDDSIKINQCQQMDGLELLQKLHDNIAKAVFFDPQYDGLALQKSGAQPQRLMQRRYKLPQMSTEVIANFLQEIERILQPSGYLFLWTDNLHLREGLLASWLKDVKLKTVDMMVWDKSRIGLGYRTRKRCEFLMILQKKPIVAKKTWTMRNIPNVWQEKVDTTIHPHTKPIELQKTLLQAVSQAGDIIIDPAMGSGSVMQACLELQRIFIGGDINYS